MQDPLPAGPWGPRLAAALQKAKAGSGWRGVHPRLDVCTVFGGPQGHGSNSGCIKHQSLPGLRGSGESLRLFYLFIYFLFKKGF